MGWCIYVSPTLSIRPALPFPFCPHVLWTLTFDPPFLLWTTSPNSRPRQKAKTTMGFWFLPFLRDYSPSCLLSSSQIKLFFFFFPCNFSSFIGVCGEKASLVPVIQSWLEAKVVILVLIVFEALWEYCLLDLEYPNFRSGLVDFLVTE